MTAITTAIDTRFGRLAVTEAGGAIVAATWSAHPHPGPATPLLRAAADQIASYGRGELTRFDLPLRLSGSAFLVAVCKAMLAIPQGETRTYGDIAADLGQPAQAIGRACGANPIALIVPCHRVLGAGGRLTGYSGGAGVETKLALLRHEGGGGFLI
jgi:methylated-DNA-[protein]-cysteine S-methyltransferase